MAEDRKKIEVVIDRSEEIKSKDAKIEQLNQKIGSQEELLKKYLAMDAERERKDVESKIDKPAPESGDTCTLDQEEQAKKGFKIPYDEDSQILDMNPSFNSTEEAIGYLKNAASNPQCGDYKIANLMYAKAVKKALREGGTFEFQGNLCKWERKGDHVVKASRKSQFKKIEDS